MRRRTRAALLSLALLAPAHYLSAQTFLDITALATGTSGSFNGTIGAAIPVFGAIFSPGGGFAFNATDANSVGGSTVNNTSTQFGYASIFSPSIAQTDRIGFSRPAGSGTATVQIAFGAPVLNPVFHFANLDVASFNFSMTAGVSLTLLSGNGGSGDGLGVSGTTVADLNPATALEQTASTAPTTTGNRSGYGSVQLNGMYQLVYFTVTANPQSTFGDNGSFTISLAPTVVPEPGTVVLVAGGLLGLVSMRRFRRRR